MGSSISVVLSPAKRVWVHIWWRIPDSNRGPADYDAQKSLSAMFGVYRITVEFDGYYCVIHKRVDGAYPSIVAAKYAVTRLTSIRRDSVVKQTLLETYKTASAEICTRRPYSRNQAYKVYKLDPLAAIMAIRK